MSQRVRKITPDVLKKIIVQEARKLQREAAQEKAKRPEDVTADEVEADEYADTLEHHVDHYKTLKMHEARLKAKLAQIQEAQTKIRRKVSRIAK